MSTAIEVDTPALALFTGLVQKHRGAESALEEMIHGGRLGDLIGDLQEVAKAVEKSKYVPPSKREEVEKWSNLAKSVDDRELANHYRQRAKRAASQIGEK